MADDRVSPTWSAPTSTSTDDQREAAGYREPAKPARVGDSTAPAAAPDSAPAPPPPARRRSSRPPSICLAYSAARAFDDDHDQREGQLERRSSSGSPSPSSSTDSLGGTGADDENDRGIDEQAAHADASLRTARPALAARKHERDQRGPSRSGTAANLEQPRSRTRTMSQQQLWSSPGARGYNTAGGGSGAGSPLSASPRSAAQQQVHWQQQHPQQGAYPDFRPRSPLAQGHGSVAHSPLSPSGNTTTTTTGSRLRTSSAPGSSGNPAQATTPRAALLDLAPPLGSPTTREHKSRQHGSSRAGATMPSPSGALLSAAPAPAPPVQARASSFDNNSPGTAPPGAAAPLASPCFVHSLLDRTLSDYVKQEDHHHGERKRTAVASMAAKSDRRKLRSSSSSTARRAQDPLEGSALSSSLEDEHQHDGGGDNDDDEDESDTAEGTCDDTESGFTDDDDDDGASSDELNTLTRQLAETATSVREMSKQLGRARMKSQTQSVMIITKARDNHLVRLTRELALWLMKTPRNGRERGLIVYVDSQLKKSKRFDADALERDEPELFRPLRRYSRSSSFSSVPAANGAAAGAAISRRAGVAPFSSFTPINTGHGSGQNSANASSENLATAHLRRQGSIDSKASSSRAASGAFNGGGNERDSDEGQLRYWTSEMCTKSPHLFDFVITLGGDGTVLYCSWLFQHVVPPVIPFALGSLGFLTNFDFSNYQQVMNAAIDDGVRVNLRMRFTCTVYRAIEADEAKARRRRAIRSAKTGEIFMNSLTKEGWEAIENGGGGGGGAHACADKEVKCFLTRPVESFEVLNDLVVDRGPSPYVSLLELFGDDHHMTTVQADGLTVSTPTGSTAYSLSAGGSLVHPEIPALLITPICPHTLSFRPMLLPDSMELRICVPYNSRSTAWASFDGRGRVELRQGDHIKVTASQYPFPTVCKDKQSTDWFHAIARTLKWNERQRQKSFVILEENRKKPQDEARERASGKSSTGKSERRRRREREQPATVAEEATATVPARVAPRGEPKPTMAPQAPSVSGGDAPDGEPVDDPGATAEDEEEGDDDDDEDDDDDDEEEEDEDEEFEEEAYDIDDISSENQTNASSPASAPADDPRRAALPGGGTVVPSLDALVQADKLTDARLGRFGAPPTLGAGGEGAGSTASPSFVPGGLNLDTMSETRSDSDIKDAIADRFSDPAPKPRPVSLRHTHALRAGALQQQPATPTTATIKESHGARQQEQHEQHESDTDSAAAIAARRDTGEEGDRDYLREPLDVKREILSSNTGGSSAARDGGGAGRAATGSGGAKSPRVRRTLSHQQQQPQQRPSARVGTGMSWSGGPALVDSSIVDDHASGGETTEPHHGSSFHRAFAVLGHDFSSDDSQSESERDL